MKAVLPALARPLIEAQLPAGLDVHWFTSLDEAVEMVADADIGWVDNNGPANWARAVAAGRKLQWLSTIYAGLDPLDKDQLRAQGTRVTNGSGVNAHTVAEYAVMGALVAAKRYDQVVRIADTHVWPFDAPGKLELFETGALVIASPRSASPSPASLAPARPARSPPTHGATASPSSTGSSSPPPPPTRAAR
jgi:phosphoglycerate dehydrogenase-like enzyme